MRHLWAIRQVVLMSVCCSSAAFAQLTPLVTVGPPVQVNDLSVDTREWFECTLAATQLADGRLLVVARKENGRIGHALGSVDGAGVLSFQDLGSFQFGGADVIGGDPGAACGVGSDQIWLCALRNDGGNVTIAVSWLDPLDSAIDPANTHSAGPAIDKPLIAVSPAGPAQTPHHILANRKDGNDPITCPDDLWHHVAFDPDLNQTWVRQRVEPVPDTSGCDYRGWGATPVVLDGGRIVVVVRDTNADGGGYYNFNLPYVVYTDDDGMDWFPDQGGPIPVDGLASITATTVDADYGIPSDTPFGIDRRKGHPAIAIDRRFSPNHVYVAFYARAAPGSTNTDIHIVRSTDGGESFAQLPQDHFVLTDLELLETQPPYPDIGPDQVMPAITIDDCGAINLLFYDNRFDPYLSEDPDNLDEDSQGNKIAHEVDVYFARITGFGVSPTVYTERLTSQSFPIANDGEAASMLGDYHHIVTASADQRTLFAAYIVKNWNGSEWRRDCIARRIKINRCLSDLNMSGAADPGDSDLFFSALLAEDPLADVNSDSALDGVDIDLFLDSYEGDGGGD